MNWAMIKGAATLVPPSEPRRASGDSTLSALVTGALNGQEASERGVFHLPTLEFAVRRP
jgi:hypothetical protein